MRFFEIFIIFAHPCLRPPQNLVLFLEAGEGPGKPGSALEGVGGCKGHPWSAQKQTKPKSQKSIFVIFRDFREFCSLPLPVLFTEAGWAGEVRPVGGSGWSRSALETPRGRRRWPVTPESTQDRYKMNPTCMKIFCPSPWGARWGGRPIVVRRSPRRV